MNEQVELLRDSKHRKELADIKEKTKNQKSRGGPTKTQLNSQPETVNWSKPTPDPWSNSQMTITQERINLSDDEDRNSFTNYNVEPNFGEAERVNRNINLSREIRAKPTFQLIELNIEKARENHRNILHLQKGRRRNRNLHTLQKLKVISLCRKQAGTVPVKQMKQYPRVSFQMRALLVVASKKDQKKK
jgi:hypothetical protein